MPRNYIRKSERATKYSQEDLEIAVEKVKSKELTNYAAAKMFNIPPSTLNDRVLAKKGLKSDTMGRPPALPIEAETRLANCLRTLEKWGFGLSREEIFDIVTEFIKKNKLKTPFKNDTPGPDWFIAFRKRHRLSIKKPQSVEYLRKKMTDPFIIHEYFTIPENTLKELNITNDPKAIWNLDETSICLDPTKTKVVGGKGLPCCRTTSGTGKENVTVLTTVNANGDKLNPLIVFKAKSMYEKWMATEKKDHDFEIAYAVTKRGWMETEVFYNYMKDVVIPGLGEKRPVLMVYDGHCTHVDDRVVELALQNGITILKLPAHTSHLLQPLDLAVFKSLKSIMDKKLVKWQRKNVGAKLQKQEFSETFADVWHITKPEVIQNGFKKAGIFPYNANVIPIDKYEPAAYKRWLQHTATKNSSNFENHDPATLKQLCLNALNQKLVCATLTCDMISAPTEVNFTTTPEVSPPLRIDVPTFEVDSLQVTLASEKVLEGSPKVTFAPKVNPVSFPVSTELICATGLVPRLESTFITQAKSTPDNYTAFGITTDKNILPDTCNFTSDNGFDSTPVMKPVPKVKITSCVSIENLEHKANYVRTFEDLLLDKMQQQCRIDPKKNVVKMKRITKGAEVITRTLLEKKKRSEATLDEKTVKKKSEVTLDKKTVKKKIRNSKQNTKNTSKKLDSNKITPTIISNNTDVLAIPGCSTGKTNAKRKSKTVCTVQMKRQKSAYSSDTEVSGTLSIHSDSDIYNIEDDENFSEVEIKEVNTNSDTSVINDEFPCDTNYVNRRIGNNQKILKNILKESDIKNILQETDSDDNDILHDENLYDIILDESTGQLKKKSQTNKKQCDIKQLKKKERKACVVAEHKHHKKFGNDKFNDDIRKEDVDPQTENTMKIFKETYHVKDSVLVRYYNRKWMHYIGFVESIRTSGKNTIYSIKFLKTQKKPKLKFIIPKKTDQDEVTDCSIVKLVSIVSDPENKKNYVLCNKDDEVYFFS